MFDNSSFVLFLGAALAVIYTAIIALKVRRDQKGVKTLYYGTSKLSDTQISYSIFASWMSVGNVIVAALFLTIGYGYLAIWAVFTWILGFFILSRHARHIILAASNYTTIHAFLRDRFNSPLVGKVTSLLTVITACGVITLELMVGTAIFSAVVSKNSTLITTFLCVVIFSLLTITYTRVGGLSAIIRTDLVQSVAIFLSLIAILILAYLGVPEADTKTVSSVVNQKISAEPLPHQLFSLIGFIIGFGCLQLFMLLGDMTTWQRIQLGANENTVKKAAKRSALQNLIGWSLILASGLLLMNWSNTSVQFPVVDGNLTTIISTQAEPLSSILSFASSSHTILFMVLLGIIAFGLVSAILSTCDSFLLVASQALVFEWSKPGKEIFSREKLEDETLNNTLGKLGKNLIPLMMVISLILYFAVVLLAIPLVSVIFLLLSVQTVIAPLVIVALYHKKSAYQNGKTAMLCLLVVFFAIAILFILSGTAKSLSLAYALSYLAPIIAIFIPLTVFTIIGICDKKHSSLTKIIKELFLSQS